MKPPRQSAHTRYGNEERYAVPRAAIAAFERNTALAVSLHDLGGLLKAYLPPERFGHHTPLCHAVKAGHEQGCIAFEGGRVRDAFRQRPNGFVKVCHGGLLEVCVPFIRDGRVEWVLFAGQRLPGKKLDGAFLHPAPVRIPFAKVALPRPMHSDEAAVVLELLRQLNARLQTWYLELERTGGSIEGTSSEQSFADPHARAHLIRTYIETQHRFPIKLADLAAYLHLSESRVSHAVRETCGRSFARMLAETRLKTAAGLLKHSTMTVLEVATRSGFSDVSNFHYAFREHFGVTPSRYRRREQRKDSAAIHV